MALAALLVSLLVSLFPPTNLFSLHSKLKDFLNDKLMHSFVSLLLLYTGKIEEPVLSKG